MRVYENRCRRATAPDLFQYFAVRHLRETASAVFLRRGHTKHTDASEAIDHATRYVRLPIDLCRIEMFVQELAKFSQRFIQFGLLRRWNARIGHHPIRYEMTLEKSLGEPERLRPREKQFLSLLNFLLSLRVELVHLVGS